MSSEPLRHLDGRPVTIVDVVVAAWPAKSRSEARRLIEQGGVYLVTGDPETMETLLSSVPVTGRIVVQPWK